MDLRHESSVPRALAFHAGWRRRHSQSRRCLGRRQFVSPAGETHVEADDAVRPVDQLPHEWMAMARCLTDGGTTLSSATMPSSPWPQDARDALPAGIPLNSHEVAQTSLSGAIHSSGLVDHMQLLDRFVVRTPRGLLAWSRHSAPSVCSAVSVLAFLIHEGVRFALDSLPDSRSEASPPRMAPRRVAHPLSLRLF
jgi:hypothetical protein